MHTKSFLLSLKDKYKKILKVTGLTKKGKKISFGIFAVLFVITVPLLLSTNNSLSVNAAFSSIVLKSITTNNNAGGMRSLLLTKPISVTAGDVLFAHVVVSGSSAISITAPSGWKQIRRDTSASAINSLLYYHVASANEPTSYTWTFSNNHTASGGIGDFSGVNTSSPVDVSSGTTGLGLTLTAPSVTTKTPNDMLLFIGSTASIATITPPSGMTTYWNSSSIATTSFMATQLLNTQGATGSKVGKANVSARSVSELVALLPQTIVPTATPKLLPTATPVPTAPPTAIPTVTGTVPSGIPTPTPTGTPSGVHIISTLYAYPTEASWSQVENSAPTVSAAIVDICAPDGSGSGCNGKPADAQATVWNPTITALKNKGITPLYYISTNYGATALSVIEGEIQNAVTWYGAPSPMFDEMEPSGTCNNGGSSMPCATYYNTLYTFSVNAGATVVMYNPGTTFNVTTADMFGPREVLQVFEGTAASFETTTFPSWMASYPANEFSATISDGTASTVGTDVTDAVKDNIANFYEDDEAEPPSYSTLPSFWTTEVSDVAAH